MENAPDWPEKKAWVYNPRRAGFKIKFRSRLVGVMVAGQWISEKEIQQRLAAVQKSINISPVVRSCLESHAFATNARAGHLQFE
jgi:hypothetical protein